MGGCLVGVLDEIKVISAPAKLELGLGLSLAIISYAITIGALQQKYKLSQNQLSSNLNKTLHQFDMKISLIYSVA